ncbi:hypothetical protein DdX_12778 [Ditylenchus destructor]|uniref:DUF7516 domain-containing protein n=1 Tax=Ditylenchus destructor TaxID=166010 RepID=A0AAD4MXK9_9BILA|nr:hypothetical protein DdX_12778 [Ditylenchus destructor]
MRSNMERFSKADHKEMKELARDKEKHARAMLPENNQNVLKGRRILARLVYKLGGENSDVTFQAIGQEYAHEYNRVFNEDERRKYFYRGNVSKILDDYCSKDLIVPRQDPNGERYIRLRRPYKEICAELKHSGLSDSPETTIDGLRQPRNENMNENRDKFRVLSPIQENISTATARTMKSEASATQSRIANFQNSGSKSSQNQKWTSQKQSSSRSGERCGEVRYTKYGRICEGNIASEIEAGSEPSENHSMPIAQNLEPELYQIQTKLNSAQQRTSVSNNRQVTFQLKSPVRENPSIEPNSFQQPTSLLLYPGQSLDRQKDVNPFENLPSSSSPHYRDQLLTTAERTFKSFEHPKPDLYDCKNESASLCDESSSGSSVRDANIEKNSNAIPSSSNNNAHSNFSPSLKFDSAIKIRLRPTRESKAEALAKMVSALVEHNAPRSSELDDMTMWLGILDPQFETIIQTELVTFIKNRCDSVTISLHNGKVCYFE